MNDGDRYYRYSVAWIDLLAKGAAPRPERADPRRPRPARPSCRRETPATRSPSARSSSSPCRRSCRRRAAQPRQRRRVQRAVVPQGARGADRRRSSSISAFFHPLDVVGSWNRLYGRPGLRAVPVRRAVRRRGRAAHGRRAARRLGHAELPRRAQALRCGQPGAAQLPRPGWTLALDMPARRAAWPRCSTGSTTSCSTPGPPLPRQGRATTPAAIRRGYPRLDEWQAVRAAVDPAGVWASDQAAGCACSTTRLTEDRRLMENALGNRRPSSLLGGTSDIGRAIVARLIVARRTRTVVLAGRDPTRRRPRRARASGVDRRRGRLRRRRHRRARGVRRAASPTATATSTSSSSPSVCSASRPSSTTTRRAAAALVAGQLHRRRERRRWPSPPSSAARATAGWSCCRAWPASGCGRRTSSTARRRPASTASPRGSATRSPDGRQRARRPPRLRALEDDRRDEGGAARDHARRGRRGDGRRPAQGSAHGLGAGALRPCSPCFRHLPGPVWRRLPLG